MAGAGADRFPGHQHATRRGPGCADIIAVLGALGTRRVLNPLPFSPPFPPSQMPGSSGQPGSQTIKKGHRGVDSTGETTYKKVSAAPHGSAAPCDVDPSQGSQGWVLGVGGVGCCSDGHDGRSEGVQHSELWAVCSFQTAALVAFKRRSLLSTACWPFLCSWGSVLPTGLVAFLECALQRGDC